LDVHKDTIAVAVALPGREELAYRGEIRHSRRSLRRLIVGRVFPMFSLLAPCRPDTPPVSVLERLLPRAAGP